MERGALGLVLRLSRVMGLAPHPRGSRNRFSKVLTVYGFILVTSINIYLLSGTCTYLMMHKTPLLARDITRAVGNFVTMTLVLFGAYTAPGRMQHMATSLKRLEQINKKISFIKTVSKDRITFWLILIFIVGSLISYVINIIIFAFVLPNKIMRPVDYVIYYLEQILVVLLEMQLVAFASRTLLTLEMINKTLKHLSCIQSTYSPRIFNRYFKAPTVAWELVESNKTPVNVNTYTNNVNRNVLGTNKAKRLEDIIRQLSIYYRHVCDIIRTSNSSDGLLMTLILLNRMFHLVLLLHRLIMGLTQNPDILLTVSFYSSINGIKHVAALLLFVEPFQRMHTQMDRTSIIIQTLKCNCEEYRPLRNELDMFLRMLTLQKTSYSPLEMYTLDRPLILKIFGGLITYLMVILTYGPEAKRPSLIFANF